MTPRRTTQLRCFDYTGYHRYFLTFCLRDRRNLFISHATVTLVLEALRTAARRERFALLAYCFMPDHVHVLVGGTHETADLKRFVKTAKQMSAFRLGQTCWQSGFYERVLRSEEETEAVCSYIWQNPVRAGIVGSAEAYPFSGSDVFAFPESMPRT